MHSLRHLAVHDSRVVIGAVSKGRSSSKELNFELLLQLPDVVGGDLQVPAFYVESMLNPIDDPSRGRPVPPPSFWTPELLRIWAGAPLVPPAEEDLWIQGKWRPSFPPPLLPKPAVRRLRVGFAGVRVGESKKPGPPRRGAGLRRWRR